MTEDQVDEYEELDDRMRELLKDMNFDERKQFLFELRQRIEEMEARICLC